MHSGKRKLNVRVNLIIELNIYYFIYEPHIEPKTGEDLVLFASNMSKFIRGLTYYTVCPKKVLTLKTIGKYKEAIFTNFLLKCKSAAGVNGLPDFSLCI